MPKYMNLTRVSGSQRPRLDFELDGARCGALEGDTVLTAAVMRDGYVRRSEFDQGMRAGFCWMGACQDCWVTIEGRGRQRACATVVEQGMRVKRS
ncbi:MAG: (2Fe-2S)-binding protein [Methylobacteriaceae bacterium]|jgi:predicted molibdopterin-dependent oxidoreductase YjgC|nr:(2Fe-2S)-binding protein [Methylobacteriaceae bacterium]